MADDPKTRGTGKRKEQAAEKFSQMFDGADKPSPEQVIVDVMHGTIREGSNEYTAQQIEAAKTLLPYRLPKLNNIEAHVATEEMSHEEWVASLDTGDDDDG